MNTWQFVYKCDLCGETVLGWEGRAEAISVGLRHIIKGRKFYPSEFGLEGEPVSEIAVHECSKDKAGIMQLIGARKVS